MIHENIELTGSLEISGSFIIPLGDASDREGSPTTGSLFYNTASRALETYTGNAWVTQSSGGGDETPSTFDIEYLVVAGGGGGGSRNYGGGGGAGGLLSSSLSSQSSGNTLTITVGAGGGGATNGQGSDGNDSSLAGTGFTTITSVGGGGGGGSTSGGSTLANGRDGGSGGGVRVWSVPTPWIPGDGTAGQGNDGGHGDTANSNYGTSPNVAFVTANYLSKSWGSGGGGAGTVGINCHWMTNQAEPGRGGAGLQSSITGTATYYAGGGGGGQNANNGSGTAGYGPYTTANGYTRLGCTEGGLGGGGAGGKGFYTPYYTAIAGTANLGGGGGGGSHSNGSSGASGGSGVVILRVLTSVYSGTSTGSPTVTTDGDYTILQFNSSGTYTT